MSRVKRVGLRRRLITLQFINRISRKVWKNLLVFTEVQTTYVGFI